MSEIIPTPTKPVLEILQFEIHLKDSNPLIWRRIQLPSVYSFHELHLAIQKSMRWSNEKQHRFGIEIPGKSNLFIFGSSKTDNLSRMIGNLSNDFYEEQLNIGLSFNRPSFRKIKIIYRYDFDDKWDHVVTLEKKFVPCPGHVYTICISGKYAHPPEGCGGIDAYLNRRKHFMGSPIVKKCMIEKGKRKGFIDEEFYADEFDPKNVWFSI